MEKGMETIFEELEGWGCDIKGAKERFLDDDELLMVCLETAVMDENFGKLGLALAEGKKEEAFESAHTLKGVYANLGLIPLYRIIECIVEPLRDGNAEDLMADYSRLVDRREQLCRILGK